MLIGVDVDEVCADMLHVWIDRYNRTFEDNVRPEDITDWNLTKFLKPAAHSTLYDLLDDIYDEVQPCAGARLGVSQLREMGHEVVFVSACTRRMYDAKLEWLIRWGFLSEAHACRDFIATKRKELVRMDMLIDDNIDTVNSFPGLSLLVTQPHNAGRDCHHMRVSSLAAAPRAVQLLGGGTVPALVATGY